MYKESPKVKTTIKCYLKELSELGVEVQKVILYGSYAKGNFRKDSDIDFVVVSDNFKRMNLRKRLEVLGIAAVRLMKPIEAYGVTPDEIKSPVKVTVEPDEESKALIEAHKKEKEAALAEEKEKIDINIEAGREEDKGAENMEKPEESEAKEEKKGRKKSKEEGKGK